MNTVPIEKKMQLLKELREENLSNQGRLRSREEILYGKAILPEPEREEETYAGLKIRFFFAAILFAAFLLMDAGKISLQNYDSTRIVLELKKDMSFLEGNPIDFINELSYTLNDMLKNK